MIALCVYVCVFSFFLFPSGTDCLLLPLLSLLSLSHSGIVHMMDVLHSLSDYIGVRYICSYRLISPNMLSLNGQSSATYEYL